ncbi:MAG: LPS-assembly protein LptD, partial [Ignavibacteriales bacterium]|nr:LPS-assembly protein LptD [Ignavibacteriales bacterium]
MMVGKRIIARPVILYFGDVPVMALPYGIFPQQHGRTSGILIPTYGESSGQGRFLRDLGYYWAMSDYMDTRASVDFYERFGFLGRANFRYNKRYVLSGSADFDFNATTQGETQRRDYAFGATHQQIIDQYTRFSVAGRYVSNQSYYRDVGTVQDQLNQSVQSNATFSRNWEYWPWSLNVNANYTQNIRANTWSAALPAVSFTHKAGQLFPPPAAPRGIRGATAPKELYPPWYRNISYNYGVIYRNDMAMPRAPKVEGYRIRDFAPVYGTDSTTIFQKDGLVHSGGIGANARLLKYINLNPRLGISLISTRRALEFEARDSILYKHFQDGFFQRVSFDVGGSMNTKLYGYL